MKDVRDDVIENKKRLRKETIMEKEQYIRVEAELIDFTGEESDLSSGL